MAVPVVDSATVVNTGNQVVQLINVIWPIVASILAYVAGHKWTSRKKPISIPKV